jgi:hypothetical protein
MAIQIPVVGLVRVGQDAFIAGVAAFLALVVTSRWVKMKPFECSRCNLGDEILLLDESSQYADTSFGCLPEHDSPAHALADPFGRQLGFFDLEGLFDAPLEGILERRHRLFVLLYFLGRVEDKEVVGVIHEQPDQLLVLVVRIALRVNLPVHEIDQIAVVGASLPTVIDSEERCRGRKRRPDYGLGRVFPNGGIDPSVVASGILGKSEVRCGAVAPADTLFLVTGDALTPGWTGQEACPTGPVEGGLSYWTSRLSVRNVTRFCDSVLASGE